MKYCKSKLHLCVTMMLVASLLTILLPLVSADLGTYKQNTCVNIKTILNATSVNISTISSPSSILITSNKQMTKIGQTFNYTFCNTSEIGVYVYDYYDNYGDAYVNSFTINPTGYFNNLIFLYIIMFAFPWGLFLLGLWKRDMTLAIFGTIGFYLVALYLLLYGINGTRDMLSNGLGVIHLGVAFYTSIRYTLESIDLNW